MKTCIGQVIKQTLPNVLMLGTLKSNSAVLSQDAKTDLQELLAILLQLYGLVLNILHVREVMLIQVLLLAGMEEDQAHKRAVTHLIWVAAIRKMYSNLPSQKVNVLKQALKEVTLVATLVEIMVITMEVTMEITMVEVILKLAVKEIKMEVLKEITVIKSMIW